MRKNVSHCWTMRAKLFLSVFFVVTCLSSYEPRCLAQGGENLMTRRVTLRVKDGTMEEALGRLATEEPLPIGWEVPANDIHRHDINIDLKNTALKDVLDFLVLADPSYRWELQDGVINLVPAYHRDELLKKFLSLRIKKFAPPRGLNKFAFRDVILDLPEVRNFLESNGLEASHTGAWTGGPPPSIDVEFQMADTELRVILNRAIRDTNLGWALSRSGPDLKTLNLIF